jgi:hypothetical protein
MEERIEIESEGQIYIAYYSVWDDALTVQLPNGVQRSTILNGLNAKSAALTHLRGYVNGLARTATDGSIS